jgi:excisionase family DNA binding protein
MGTDDADRGTLTVEETAARLGISRTLAYELARTGRLPVPVLRLGRRVMVSRTALERVLAAERVDHGEVGGGIA